MTSDLLTTRELALRWRVSEHHIKIMRTKGDGPAYVRVGDRAIRYRLSDVVQWENERRQSVRTAVIDAAIEYAERASKPQA